VVHLRQEQYSRGLVHALGSVRQKKAAEYETVVTTAHRN
jgi:hypothetical protein